MKGSNQIVTGYAQMWPREVFDIREGKNLLVRKLGLLEEPGVYILYREDVPHYIGKTRRHLRERIWNHANQPGDKYYNFWNFFSAFTVREESHLDEIEGILIAAIPTANSANPRIKRINLPPRAVSILKKLRRQTVDIAMR
ncbi:MAG TPA: GIY-YIG nuclease family protein [Terriglobia bacterium]|nr:GIY-YIG nuclease family protein [Terriglobia bacterium]